MTYKKIFSMIALFLILMVTVVLQGCNQKDSSATEDPPSSQKQESSATQDQKESVSEAQSDDKSSGEKEENQKVSNDYFDDAVFIGDSVTLKLKYYVQEKRKSNSGFMGKAQFLCSGSLGVANSLWPISNESVHPMYQGEKMLLEDSVAKMGAKKVYIMLGVNDIGLYGVEDSIKNMQTLVERIQSKSPQAVIYLQSVTPMVEEKQLKQLNNQSILQFDEKLSQLCSKKGYHFVDVASVMRDKNNALPLEYCSDPSGKDSLGIHFTDKACNVWIKYLLEHANET